VSTSATFIVPPGNTSFLGHPRGLSVLFSTEMFERFSFYGMRALLVLYLSAPTTAGGLGVPAPTAMAIYSIYNSVVYLAALPGGWIADRWIAGRRAVAIGGVLIAAGNFVLGIRSQTAVIVGLGLIAAGTGLLKPTMSSLVGQLYAPDDRRRDAGFSLFYLGINVGAFIAPLVTGWVGQTVSYNAAFVVAGGGMLIGLGQYLLGGKWLGDVGLAPARPLTAPEKRAVLRKTGLWAAVGVLALAVDAVVTGSIDPGTVITAITVIILAAPVVILTAVLRTPTLTRGDRDKVRAFVALFVGAAIFWLIYDQAGSVLVVFIELAVDTTVGAFTVPTEWFQSINPLFVILLSPVFARLWMGWGDRAPSTTTKFAIGLGFVGSSFWVMAAAATVAATGQLVSPLWLVAVNLLQVLGELFLSPVGLAATTRLAPPGLGSQFLGLWFLATAVGNAVAAQVTRLTTVMSGTGYFLLLGGSAVLAAFVFFWLRKTVDPLMGEGP
jgi:POT family proton-dependent oligopeptide transporter